MPASACLAAMIGTETATRWGLSAEASGHEEKESIISPRQAGTAQGLFPFINDEPHIWKVRSSSLPPRRCLHMSADARHTRLVSCCKPSAKQLGCTTLKYQCLVIGAVQPQRVV